MLNYYFPNMKGYTIHYFVKKSDKIIDILEVKYDCISTLYYKLLGIKHYYE